MSFKVGLILLILENFYSPLIVNPIDKVFKSGLNPDFKAGVTVYAPDNEKLP